MACCAFAIFLVLNLLFALGLLRRAPASAQQNPVVAWRFSAEGHSPAVVTPSSPGRRPRRVGAAPAIYLGVIAIVALYWVQFDGQLAPGAISDKDWDAVAALNATWCLSDSSKKEQSAAAE